MPFKSDKQRKAVMSQMNRDDRKYRNSISSRQMREHSHGNYKYSYVMSEYRKGTLHDSHGNIVTDERQARAIAISESNRGQNYGKGKKERQEEKVSELTKGRKVEREHASTIRRIRNEKLSTNDAETLIAKDHIKEDPKYYSKLEHKKL